jgi:hypothetical protein
MCYFRDLSSQEPSVSCVFLLAFGVTVLGCSGNSAPNPGGSGAGPGSAGAAGSASPGGVSGSPSTSAGSTSGGASGASAGSASGGAATSGSGGGDSAGTTSGGNAGAGGAGTTDPNKRKLLLRDEGNSAVHYVDLAEPLKSWHQTVPVGRDLQLIGARHFLIGTETGYQERNLDDGKVVKDVTDYPGTLDVHRLHNGNTLLSGVAFHGGQGIVLVEINPQGTVARQIEYPGTYARLVREAAGDHFFVSADTHVFEGDAQGKVVWDVTVEGGPAAPHAWEALRLASGDVVVAAGYAAGLEIFGADMKLKQTITGGDGVMPYFFSGMQIMQGGSFVVANWQGHGIGLGGSGLQVVEYDASGKLIWSWKQDPSFVSSLQHLIVLDGLDLDKLQVESLTTGVLEAVN